MDDYDISQSDKEKNLKKTILIIGVSSFIGSNLAEYLKHHFRVIGTFYEHPVRIADIVTVQCDILSRDSVQILIYTFRPDVTIYCAGLTSIDDCNFQDKYCDTVNAVGAYNVASFTERYKSCIVYLSSAYVFSGLDRYFNENDTPDPSTIYGKSKASAEFFIQKSCLNYLIFRCCQFYGRSTNPRQMNIFEFLQQQAYLGKQIPCDGNINTGFLDVIYLAHILKMAIERDVSNRLFQMSSADHLSPYEFAKLYFEIFQLPGQLISKTIWPFVEMRRESAVVEGDKRFFKLSNTNIENYFNIKMPTIRESLELSFKRLGGHFKDRKKKLASIGVDYI